MTSVTPSNSLSNFLTTRRERHWTSPTVQTCEEGETAWVQTPAEGQDADELEAPAPQLTVTKPGADDPAGESGVEAGAAGRSGRQTPLVITSLVIGSLGLVVAIIAVARGRKKA